MTRVRVTYKIHEEPSAAQLHLEVAGEVWSCDDVLRALGAHLKPDEAWPFAVASAPLGDDADLTERAVRMHRIKAACSYLALSSISYLLDGRPMEVFCLMEA